MDKVDIEMLERLNKLKENKILTEEEFNAEKNKILNNPNNEKEEKKEIPATNNIQINEIYGNIENEVVKEQYKLIKKIVYISATIAVVGLLTFLGLSLLIYTKNMRLDSNIAADIEEVVTAVSGYALISFFTSSIIYLIILLKRRIKPELAINLLVWIIGILEIAGFNNNTNPTSIVYSALIAGLITVDLVAILAAYNRGKLNYRCPECNTKMAKGQDKCPNCNTKIDWN